MLCCSVLVTVARVKQAKKQSLPTVQQQQQQTRMQGQWQRQMELQQQLQVSTWIQRISDEPGAFNC
jgi:hypothetical protein